MDDASLLQSAQLVQTDPDSGKSGVTLAGVMLFGHDSQIRQVCPAHRTDPQLIEGDNFRMVISVPEFGENPARTTKIISTQQVTQQVKRLIAVSIGELSRAELMQVLGIKDRVSFSRNYIEPALKYNLLEMTQPDSPKSPTQKYRITEKGREIFEKMDKL